MRKSGEHNPPEIFHMPESCEESRDAISHKLIEGGEAFLSSIPQKCFDHFASCEGCRNWAFETLKINLAKPRKGFPIRPETSRKIVQGLTDLLLSRWPAFFQGQVENQEMINSLNKLLGEMKAEMDGQREPANETSHVLAASTDRSFEVIRELLERVSHTGGSGFTLLPGLSGMKSGPFELGWTPPGRADLILLDEKGLEVERLECDSTGRILLDPGNPIWKEVVSLRFIPVWLDD